jgi:nucleotide-binding universal stress UspA family protein
VGFGLGPDRTQLDQPPLSRRENMAGRIWLGEYSWKEEQQMSAQEYGKGPRIVVGVDGSDSSLSALRWAIRQAGLTGAAVDAVAAWHYPVAAGGYGYVPMGTGQEYDFKGITEKVLADAISSTVDPGSGVIVRSHVVEGNAAQVLLDACDGADLLVVGSRGHGGFTEALLGSVSQHLVHHAPCPVVVIRGQDQP